MHQFKLIISNLVDTKLSNEIVTLPEYEPLGPLMVSYFPEDDPRPAERIVIPCNALSEINATNEDSTLVLKCNRFNYIFIEHTTSQGVAETQLSTTPKEIGNLKFKIAPYKKPNPKIKATFLGLLKAKFFKNTCKYCISFDQKAAHKWRHEPTHTFSDGSTKEMWDDIMQLEASQLGLKCPDDKDIGLCASLGRIVHANNIKCEKFSKA